MFFPKLSGDVATPQFLQSVAILSIGISLGSARRSIGSIWIRLGKIRSGAYRMSKPSSSTRKIEHGIPSLWASIKVAILVRISVRDLPTRIIFNASTTA